MSNSNDKFIFITGGRRSGKSSYALEMGESLGNKRLYIATAEILDMEMKKRVARHRVERGNNWDTIEEPLVISEVVANASDYDVILIDCLTLWLCNLLHENNRGDDRIVDEINSLIHSCIKSKSYIITISNETGSGIIPDNPLSRRFSDLAGIMNQRMAAAAGRVILTVSGIPVNIKGS